MAFKMNRPLIKGTPIHKASIAKAKAESIVAQTRTQADSSLVGAGDTLGKSYIPIEIDYSMDLKAVKIPDSKKKGSGKKGKKEFDGEKDANEPSNKKEIQEVREGKGFGEGPGTKGWGKNENTKKLSLSDRWKAKRLKKRLAKAEKDGGVSTDTDYSQIDNEPKTRRVKAESYKTPSASSAEAKENKERMDKSQEVSLNKAAKKYGVKPSDLEAKEINSKKDYFPKEGALGGTHRGGEVDKEGKPLPDKGTQWSDAKGRFLIPTGGYSDEEILQMSSEEKAVYEKEMDTRAQKAVDEANKLKPTQGNIKKEDLSDVYQMIQNGNIALNEQTNSYEYTDLYRKTQTTIANKNNTKTSEPVVEEDQNIATTRTREQKENDKIYNDFRTSKYKKKKMIEGGYNPIQSKSPVEMRDDRIYRNALKDGPVRKNMIKGGYTPR